MREDLLPIPRETTVSDLLHPTRLAWDGRRGIARHGGVEIILKSPPPALPDIYTIEFDPALGLNEIKRYPHSPPGEQLLPPEAEAVIEWLGQLEKWGRRFLMMRPRQR